MFSTADLLIFNKKRQIVTFIKQSWGGKKLSFELSCSNLDSSELCIFLPTVVLGGSRKEGLEGRIIFTASPACRSARRSGPFACTWPPSVLFLLRKCFSTSVCLLMDICKIDSALVRECSFIAKPSYHPPGGHYVACSAGRTHLGSWGHPYMTTQETGTGCVKI